MSTIRTVIVEDIPAELAWTKNQLSIHCPDVELVGETGHLEEATRLIKATRPDLLLMDIEIRGGTSYDLLDRLETRGVPVEFEIVFMTGHRKFDYATMAFAYSALDFLTKPIDPVFLQKAVQKAQQRVKPEQYLKQIDLFMELIRSPDHKNTRLAVHLAGGIVEFITIDHILYLEADKATTTFILQDQTSLKSNRNLGQYDFLLQTHHNFFSISNSLLVNLNYIKRYDHREKAVTLTNGTVLYASRRGGQDLRHYMANQAVKPELDKNTILAFLKKLVL